MRLRMGLPRRVLLDSAKVVRNVLADAAAHAMVALPPLERQFRAAGGYVGERSLIGALHRRTRDTLTTLLKRDARRYRRVEVGGVPMIMDVTEFTCHRLYFHGEVYEPATVKCLVDRLRPGGTFIDVGANHGYFSVLAAQIVGPGGRVVAFEPNPAVFDQLCDHVARNALTNVTAERLALADVDGPTELFLSACATNSGLSSIAPEADGFARGSFRRDRRIAVSAMTFDRWRTARGLDRIDLMKVDVEGAEAAVLRGMRQTLATMPPAAIICEVRGSTDQASAILAAHGYQGRNLDASESYRNVLYLRSTVR